MISKLQLIHRTASSLIALADVHAIHAIGSTVGLVVVLLVDQEFWVVVVAVRLLLKLAGAVAYGSHRDLLGL